MSPQKIPRTASPPHKLQTPRTPPPAFDFHPLPRLAGFFARSDTPHSTPRKPPLPLESPTALDHAISLLYLRSKSRRYSLPQLPCAIARPVEPKIRRILSIRAPLVRSHSFS